MNQVLSGFAAGYLAVTAWRFAAAARPWPAVLCGVVAGLLYSVVIYRIVSAHRRRPS